MTDPLLQAAAAQSTAWLFGALKIEFPDHTLRLVDGSAEIMIGGELYTGTDEVFGTIETLDVIDEQMDDEAPEITIGLLPPDASASATLASPLMQVSRVTIMLGAWDPVTGLCVGTPEVLFLGEIDVPTIELARGKRSVSYTVVSVFERLFEINEGERASDGFHQSIWPGELGLEFMTGTRETLFWGAKRQVPATVSAGGDFSMFGAGQ